MNPMQGARNICGSTTEVNQAEGESIYSTETSLNPVDNEFTNSSMPFGRPTYASSSSHTAPIHSRWRFGESSSTLGTSDQANFIGMKTGHQLSQDGTNHFVGYGSEGRQLSSNGMMAPGEVHIRNGPSFLRGSTSNPMSHHENSSMDMDHDGFGAQNFGVVIPHNNCGSALGTSTRATGESSSGPGSSSTGGWGGSSCKRKALQGAASRCFPGETPNCFGQTENAGLSQYGASSSLSLVTPSQSSSNVTNHFVLQEQMFGFGDGRAGRRLDPRQPQESVALSISHAEVPCVPPVLCNQIYHQTLLS